MFTADDFQYALENTQVLLAPKQQIATFGDTHFRFHLLTEAMDRVDEVRVREGTIHAARPALLTPDHHAKILLENFGEKARDFAEWLRTSGGALDGVLRYGFEFRRSQVKETVLRESFDRASEAITTRVTVEQENDPLCAVIRGVEDAWEVCLLKFTMDLVRGSAAGNAKDMRRRGLL